MAHLADESLQLGSGLELNIWSLWHRQFEDRWHSTETVSHECGMGRHKIQEKEKEKERREATEDQEKVGVSRGWKRRAFYSLNWGFISTKPELIDKPRLFWWAL